MVIANNMILLVITVKDMFYIDEGDCCNFDSENTSLISVLNFIDILIMSKHDLPEFVL